MRFERLHLILALPIFLSGCTFLPAVSEKQSYAYQCEMHTKELTLTTEYFDLHRGCGNEAESGVCYLAAAIGVPAISFIVSGSIVLASNTINWLEYQSTCDSNYLSKAF